MKSRDTVIIGAGPAGIATAIQLKRFGLNPLLLEKNSIGGLLKNANLVENYLGFPDGISGNALVELFKNQLEANNIDLINQTVLCADFADDKFIIKTNEQTVYSKILVIASGTEPKKLNIESHLREKILYEVYPIKNIKNKTVAVIGAGDAAFDYAENLSINNEVYILNRSKNIKCLKILLDRCYRNNKIKYIENIQLENISEINEKIALSCIKNSQKEEITVDNLLFAIGREPKLDFISNNLKTNFENLIKENLLFTIGDVKNNKYRQTAISTGDGIKAAMQIFDKLNQE